MESESSLGKKRRLGRWLHPTTRKTLIMPLDDSLIVGPVAGLRNMSDTIERICEGRVDAILGYRGLFLKHATSLREIPGILNVTASTMRYEHTRKIAIGEVEDALRMGLQGVAVHVNVSSKFESSMLQTLGSVASKCDSFGMPLFAIMYPRSEGIGIDENYLKLRAEDRKAYADFVAHCVRIAVEAGADIVKTQYTGDTDSFRTVIEAAGNTPVVIAGGPLIAPDALLQVAHDAMRAGAAGLSFGRNVYSRNSPTAVVRALRAIVHDGVAPRDLAGSFS